jgi:putative heme-binding domain-containing protein
MDGTRILRLSLCATLFAAFMSFCCTENSVAQEAEWIWSPQHRKDQVPGVECFFRKRFDLNAPDQGEIMITADDTYEIFVNGKKAATGSGTRRLDRYNISNLLVRGQNIVAVRVENTNGNTAALVARVQVKEKDGNWVSHSTDGSWKSNLKALPLWQLKIYNDSRWQAAQSYGKLGSTIPWDRQEQVQVAEQTDYERFHISRDFDVVRVAEDAEVGSVIAFTINEFGEIIYSREGEALWILDPQKPVEDTSRNRPYCLELKNCQGILALNGSLYVTGDGPDGLGLYRLSDHDVDGTIESIKMLLPFKGKASEHGPHGLTLGPEGLLYVVLGNHTSVEKYAETSPIRQVYEGDVLTPRFEDPGGHAVGIKAPGGVILRTDLDGKKVELVASGLRNSYDLTFNDEGELFTYDSDMESDIGTSWYRPTTLYHVTSGAEFGWRSGWAKWPDYFVDALPGILDTGRGSPTGAVVYDHMLFPPEYQHAVFLGDWSEGRIIACRLKQVGASYVADSEVFLQGDPLNVTDLEVGEDGALYFSTGGRGTAGGMYRITWKNAPLAEKQANMHDPVSRLIRQPQMQSSWARQNIAELKIEMGEQFNKTLIGVAISDENPAEYRTRALQLMHFYGPAPSMELLATLSKSNNEQVRSKVAELLGMSDMTASRDILISMLEDSDRRVRRKACEGLLRSEQTVPLAKLQTILVSDDRFEAWAARRLLERLPELEWREEILTSENQRLFIQGATALLIAYPSQKNAYAILARSSQFMDGFVSDRNFVDLLRVMQLSMVRGKVDPTKIPAFRERIADEFPSGNSIMNRELARLLAYLQIHEIGDRYVEYLNSATPSFTDRLHVALHLGRIKSGFTSKQRLAILEFLESSRNLEGSGGSYDYYLAMAAQDFARSLTSEDAPVVLARGADWPNGAIGALYHLPPKLDSTQLELVKNLDQQIDARDDSAYDQLKSGLVAILARSGDESAMSYLRQVWQQNPERRSDVAMGLALQPDGDNWPYIVSSLSMLSDSFAGDVLEQLTLVNRRPTDPEFYRQVILKGLSLNQSEQKKAVSLLKHWSGFEPDQAKDLDNIAAWQKWYAEQYPDRPPAKLPEPVEGQRWDVEQLMEFLASDEANEASLARGHDVFIKAQCANCHRFDGEGKGLGPDLTAVSKRFSAKEILESIIYPSHVISDQYASSNVTDIRGRQFTGLLTVGANESIGIVQSDGRRIDLTKDSIESIEPSPISSMPNGLLEGLSPQEIADLFAYLRAIDSARVAHRASVRETKQR